MTNETQNQLPPRFVWWSALTLFSAISAVAAGKNLYWIKEDFGYYYEDEPTPDGHDRWAVATTSISAALSLLIVVAHFVVADKLVNKPVEGGISFLITVLWIAGMNAIMGLATAEWGILETHYGDVARPEKTLYFFSWASLITSLYVTGHFAKSMGGRISDKIAAVFPKITKWTLLLITSTVVLAPSAKMLDDMLDWDWQDFGMADGWNFCEENNSCKCTKYFVALGSFVTVMSLLAIVLASLELLKTTLETCMLLLAFLMYLGGGLLVLGIVPKEPCGPSEFGNQYFATWFGCVLSLVFLAPLLYDARYPKDTSEEDSEEVLEEANTPNVVEEKPQEQRPSERLFVMEE